MRKPECCMDSSQGRDGRSESSFHGIPSNASSWDSWKLNLQQNSSHRRDGLGQVTLLTRNLVLQGIPRNWLHNDDAARILPGIVWNQCHFYRKSNFNGLLRIFVFMRFPKTAWIHPKGGARVATMEFLAMRLHEILGNWLPNRIIPTGGMVGTSDTSN